MRLTTVGTGTAAPSPHRVCSAQLVEAGDARILLDCGSGAVHRMASLGIDWSQVSHVVLSHFHADHISDLATLFYAWRYGTIPWRTEPVSLIGPPGTTDLLSKLDALCGGALATLGYGIETHELDFGGSLQLPGNVRLESRKVPHTAESVAYSIEHSGRRFVYTGDTGPDPELGSWAGGCDVLLAECSLPADLRIESHLTPEDCAELAAGANPGMLVLTHFYPPVEQVDVRAIIAERYEGRVFLARDGWSVRHAADGGALEIG